MMPSCEALAQRRYCFLGDVGAAVEVNESEVGAALCEGEDRGVGDVGAAAEVNFSEVGAALREGEDRGVGEVGAVIEVNGGEVEARRGPRRR